ncbi:MAG: DUF885 domain-containing protein [Acidobacteria bacterium]|nr:DUF885 domain-containing protein [Acidobacteriota bacterium]
MKWGLMILLLIFLPLSVVTASQGGASKGLGASLDALVKNAEGLSEGERLHQLLDLSWDWAMAVSPESATYVGYPGHNDEWTDWSEEGIQKRWRGIRLQLSALESIDRARLSEADRINYDLFRKELDEQIEGIRFPDHYVPINQMQGVQQDAARMVTMMPATSPDDYEDIIARLNALPRLIDQTIALMNRGLEKKVTPPRITLRNVPGQVKNMLVDDAMRSPLLRAFGEFPDTVPEKSREALRRRAVEAYEKKVRPAFERLHTFLVDEYLPKTRESIALSDLPDGKAWYAYNVRRMTTTKLSPEEIHEIGLGEVRRIRVEMDRAIERTGFKGTFAEFTTFLRDDPRFYFERAEDLLQAYRDIAKRADPELARLFGRLPRLPYGVLPVPAYAEKSQTTAYYSGGSLEAGRPGYFYANTYDLKSRPKWEMEALTLHEAVPGHHLQIALAQELESIPDFRRFGGYTAFVEGWGLYSESLGEDMGFYRDPYSKFGQLTYEMWRAIRLVVDTGMHAFGWSRQRAIDYFKENAGKAEHDIVVEVDRYIVWPGQALAYKLGELKIKELRARAEKKLGSRFDVRAFHDAVLGNAALPLDLLEDYFDEWLKTGASAKRSS